MLYILYTISLSAPFVLAALFLFGASGFGQFRNRVNDLIPLPSIQSILGLDNAFVNAVVDIVKVLLDLIQKAIEFIVDLVISIPSGDEFVDAFWCQFSGCCIILAFLVSMIDVH